MDLFVIDYKAGGKGCPEFIGGTLEPYPPWEPFFVDAYKSVRDLGFTFKCKLRALGCDYFTYGAQYLFSRALKSVCEQSGVPGRFAPVRVEFAGGAVDDGRYLLFCPADHRSVIDLEASTYTTDVSGDAGRPMNHEPDFPLVPNLARIDSFVVNQDAAAGASLFFCIDVGALVCTRQVAEAIGQAGLQGLRLTPIDSSYRFAKYPDLDE